METLATKYFSFLFLTIFGGGWTLPLGLPPAPEDPAVARMAPEKCLFYASWAGMAAAGRQEQESDRATAGRTRSPTFVRRAGDPRVQRCRT